MTHEGWKDSVLVRALSLLLWDLLATLRHLKLHKDEPYIGSQPEKEDQRKRPAHDEQSWQMGDKRQWEGWFTQHYHGTDAPTSCVKTHRGQGGDLGQPLWLHQEQVLPDAPSGHIKWFCSSTPFWCSSGFSFGALTTGNTWTYWSRSRGWPQKIMISLEHLCCDGRLKELELFNLEKTPGGPCCGLSGLKI